MEVVDNSNSDPMAPQMIWRRNSPYFYQLFYSSQLDWPSLTVQWKPNHETSNSKSNDLYTINELVLGTNTSNQQQNYLLIAKVRIPCQEALQRKYCDNKPSKTQTVRKNQNVMEEKIQILNRIPHQGEVNRAKYNPNQPNFIATRTPLGQIHIFNTLHLKKEKTLPQMTLAGHDTEGYALTWNPHRTQQILAGSYDGKLSLWDIKHDTNKVGGIKTYQPTANFDFHESQIQDICYNNFHEAIFLSCDDSGNAAFWDTRTSRKPIHHFQAHNSTIYSIQSAPKSEYCFSTGGGDSLIKAWDIRNLKQNLFQLKQPSGQVTQVRWSRDEKNILWSTCQKRITMWDLSVPEIPRFVHGGHRSTVSFMDLCHKQPDTVASVDQNNEIQIFQPNQNCKL